MNSKQYVVVAAWAFAGAVSSAQTVPAEAWVGRPVFTTGGALRRAEVIAELNRSRSTPQAPQDAWVGAKADAAVAVGAVTRSEVLADLDLFHRAGLDGYMTSEAFDPFSAQARRRMALYQRLRSGTQIADEAVVVTRWLTRTLRTFGAPLHF